MKTNGRVRWGVHEGTLSDDGTTVTLDFSWRVPELGIGEMPYDADRTPLVEVYGCGTHIRAWYRRWLFRIFYLWPGVFFWLRKKLA